MKRITYHFIDKRIIEVPDDCPHENYKAMREWIDCHTSKDYKIVELEDEIAEILNVEYNKSG